MKINQNFFTYLLPPTCILCGDPGMEQSDLCQACRHDLHPNHPRCYRCASNIDFPATALGLCPTCTHFLPDFDETFAPFAHSHAIRHLILNLKFRHHAPSARLLGTLLAEYVNKATDLPDCLIPVPLHKNRYRERGFNQSIEIARIIAKRLHIPLDTRSCQRHRDTAHQVGLSGDARAENIKDAFWVSPTLEAKHVAIVDDVMTTGSTVQSLAKALKIAGCHRVQVWVCSRAC
ncbi:MAG TPA: phosphoribosyltransferase [Methylococcaceae bacterium]|nr:phosphoribosyltransferase [Methylococcaceae bacterium]